jgi:hypothetical protein
LIRRRLANYTDIIAFHTAVSPSINERAEDRTRSMVGEIVSDLVSLALTVEFSTDADNAVNTS